MNERIKELAIEAKLMVSTYTGELTKSEQKFAELIVRECAGIALEQKKWVEDQEVFNPQDEQWNRARIQQSQHIADKVKQHFGVQE